MKKVLVLIAVILLIAGVVTYYFLHTHSAKYIEPRLKEKLNKLVMDASNGLYHLDIEQLEADIPNSKISLINAHLRPDTAVFAKLEQAKLLLTISLIYQLHSYR